MHPAMPRNQAHAHDPWPLLLSNANELMVGIDGSPPDQCAAAAHSRVVVYARTSSTE
jgi:hypothetical protein